MTPSTRRRVFAFGLIERSDDHVLITCPDPSDVLQRRWCFPFGPVADGESPEEAFRRLTRETFGIEVEIMVGEPPILSKIEGREVELRFFFCGLIEQHGDPATGRAIRWIPKTHLREYDFDDVSQPVVDWIHNGGTA